MSYVTECDKIEVQLEQKSKKDMEEKIFVEVNVLESLMFLTNQS